MSISTALPWPLNITMSAQDFTTNTDHPEDEVCIKTEYNGTGGNEWPYFKLAGTAYWSIVVIVVSLGLLGNMLVCVLMSDHSISVFSYTVYLKSLAVFNSMLLVIKLLEAREVSFDLSPLVDYNTAICKTWLFVSYIMSLVSPWLVVGLSVDRFFCVYFPLTRSRFCSRNNAIIVCLVLTILSALTMLPILGNVNVVNNECTRLDSFFKLFITFHLVLSTTLPCFVILILNISIIIRRSSFPASFTSNSRYIKQDKATRPLLLVTVFAFLTLVPFSVSECSQFLLRTTSLDKKAVALSRELQPLFSLIYLLNFGQNFYILILSSSRYRQVMVRMLRCRMCSLLHHDFRSSRQTPVIDSLRMSIHVIESVETSVTVTPVVDAAIDPQPAEQRRISTDDSSADVRIVADVVQEVHCIPQ